VAAIQACHLQTEIVPVAVPRKPGESVELISRDERPRADTTPENLGKLRPAFEENGTVTAGNAPGVNDGAAALVISSAAVASRLGQRPLARIAGEAFSG